MGVDWGGNVGKGGGLWVRCKTEAGGDQSFADRRLQRRWSKHEFDSWFGLNLLYR